MADYQRKINTEVTFTPSDAALTGYVWKVDGVQESTAQIFKRTFTSLGTHTVSLEGSNTCGNCVPISTTIEVVETVTPPAAGAAAQSSMLPIILGVAAFAALGIIIMAGKK
jgi:PKD repeat protein